MTVDAQTQNIDLVIDLATPGRPTLSITEAADICRVGRKTITRRLDSLANHGATKDAQGVWRIPIEALEAAGLTPGRPTPPEEQTQNIDPAAEPVVSVRVTHLTQIQNDLNNAKTRISDLERTVSIAEMALRAIEAAPTAPTQESGQSANAAGSMTWRQWRQARKTARRRIG